MEVKGEKKDARLEEIKKMVNKAVETFVDASKKADHKMSFRAFTLKYMTLEEQYSLSDIILTQAAIHLKDYTHDSLEKYTYTCATSVEDDEENKNEKNLIIWFNFSREKPEPPTDIKLTDEDLKPAFLKTEEDKGSVEVVTEEHIEDILIPQASGLGHSKITYDA
jgi:hypothetical protein